MRTMVYVLIALVAILMVLCYSLMVTAHEADERAKKMCRKLREKGDERSRQISNR